MYVRIIWQLKDTNLCMKKSWKMVIYSFQFPINLSSKPFYSLVLFFFFINSKATNMVQLQLPHVGVEMAHNCHIWWAALLTCSLHPCPSQSYLSLPNFSKTIYISIHLQIHAFSYFKNKVSNNWNKHPSYSITLPRNIYFGTGFLTHTKFFFFFTHIFIIFNSIKF